MRTDGIFTVGRCAWVGHMNAETHLVVASAIGKVKICAGFAVGSPPEAPETAGARSVAVGGSVRWPPLAVV